MQPVSSLREAMRASLVITKKDWNYQLLPVEKVVQVDVGGRRFYDTPTGERYPSVTTVLSTLSKDGIKKWEQRVGIEAANKIRKTAATRGTSVHNLAEAYVRGDEVDLSKESPTIAGAFRALQPLLAPVEVVYGIETPMYSHRLKTAGRTDLLCKYDGYGTVLDYKTSLREKKEEYIENYFIQATTYSIMAYEMYGIKLKQIVLLIFVDDAPPQKFVKFIDEYIPRTIAVFKTYHMNNEQNQNT